MLGEGLVDIFEVGGFPATGRTVIYDLALDLPLL
jgi:hypothetical protein